MIDTMPFGKWKGTPLPDVPTPYLAWLLRACKLSTGLLAAVRQELAARGVEVPAPTLPPPVTCHRCGGAAIWYSWMQFRTGKRQIRRECLQCGQWLGFAPEMEPYVSQADATASPTPILDVLTRLDELGIELESDGKKAEIPWPDRQRVPRDLLDKVRQCGHTLGSMLGRTVRSRR